MSLYDNHSQEWNEVKIPQNLIDQYWFSKTSIDSFRHNRMRSCVYPFIIGGDTKFLTVGDGRFGLDAIHLKSMGAQTVHSSDMYAQLIEYSYNEGLLDSYSEENAESLSFADESFSYALVKESAHHFPRPYIAMTELLRVVSNAVIFIEPRDLVIHQSPWLVRFLRILVNRRLNEHEFEQVGNYVYSFSEREIEKFMLGTHLRYVAFKGINDVYVKGGENVDLINKWSLISIKFWTKLWLLNFLTYIKFQNSSVLCFALFKTKPEDKLISALKHSGWTFKELPNNPYRK